MQNWKQKLFLPILIVVAFPPCLYVHILQVKCQVAIGSKKYKNSELQELQSGKMYEAGNLVYGSPFCGGIGRWIVRNGWIMGFREKKARTITRKQISEGGNCEEHGGAFREEADKYDHSVSEYWIWPSQSTWKRVIL